MWRQLKMEDQVENCGLKMYLNQITSYVLTDFIFYIAVCALQCFYFI